MARFLNRALTAGLVFLLACAVSPAATDLAKLGRACRAGKPKACDKLAQIAKNDNDDWQRMRAARELKDQTVLAELAKSGSSWQLRQTAVKELTDQAVLSDIARTDKTDKKGKVDLNDVLFVRLAAVKKLTNQALLAEIAKTDRHQPLTHQAVEKVTDQALLVEIAKGANDSTAGAMAVRKLTDQGLLVDIAKSGSNSIAGTVAVRKLTDQAPLADIAKTASDATVRAAAVRKLTDQAELGDIAETDTDPDVRMAAVMMLTNPAMLTKLAKSTGHSTVGAASPANRTDKRTITAVERCNGYGKSVTTILFNADTKPVAKWERQFDRGFIKSEKLIDLSSGKTIRIWTFDQFSRRVEERMFVCLDGNGNWVRDKEGNALLVKAFPARERQMTRIKYSKYNGRIPATKTTTIEPCENCKGETGNLCSYVY